MKTQFAATLAKEYDFEIASEYYDYIIDSMINGQRQQVRNLFNKLESSDKEYFLTTYLDPKIGIQKSVLNVCIGELV